jgi:hypothetical protein
MFNGVGWIGQKDITELEVRKVPGSYMVHDS